MFIKRKATNLYKNSVKLALKKMQSKVVKPLVEPKKEVKVKKNKVSNVEKPLENNV